MFMKHKCQKPYHEELFKLYNKLGYIEWCTICGRICDDHRHYTYAPPTQTTKPTIAQYAPRTDLYFGNEKECRNLGGGGFAEKVRRFHRLLSYACELQTEVGKIDDVEARKELVEETWKAADIRNRNVPTILAKKDFGFPCVFPDATAPAPAEAEAVLPDVKRPADEAALVPIKHEGPDNVCAVELGAHEDNRPVWQFQHKQPDGTIYRHEDTYICGEDLELALRGNVIDGRCFTPECKGKLYPEELKDIVRPEFYEVYRTNFNKANAAVVGRARWVGGVENGSPLMRPVDMGAVECALPPKKTGGKRRTYRKHKISHNRSIKQMEGYSSAINGSAGNSAPVGGRRRATAARKLKTLKRKLHKLARGGAEVEKEAAKAEEEVGSVGEEGGRRRHVMGGRRRRSTRRRRASRRSLFGLKY
jgi:hypothetical protein